MSRPEDPDVDPAPVREAPVPGETAELADPAAVDDQVPASDAGLPLTDPGATDTGATEEGVRTVPDDDPEDDADDPREILVRRGSVRRSPLYRRFFVVGALLGAVVAIIASGFGNFEASDQVRTVLPMPWGLVIFLGPLGGMIGVVIALVSDRRARRRDR